MRSLIVRGAAASMLVLAGCNRETETAPVADEATASADAMSATDAGSNASASASGGAESGGGAPAAASAGETMDPAGSMSAAPGEIIPPTDATRANAQQAAEETNLHPKPPAN